ILTQRDLFAELKKAKAELAKLKKGLKAPDGTDKLMVAKPRKKIAKK
ncbi:unnamed protein product, partial [marine sediment metagenome]